MILLLLFIFGAHIGSFLNVCIWRMPCGESVVYPPSHCPSCNMRLRGIDLVPLLSQLLLQGKCRYCGAKFSWRYFGVECLTGFLFVLVGMQSGNMADGSFMAPWTGDVARLTRDLIFVSTLIVVSFVDYDTRLIQLESVFLMGFAGVAYDAWTVYHGGNLSDGAFFAFLIPAPLPNSILAMTIAATALWIVRELFSRFYGKEAMGLGDVLLVAAIAANLGWNATLLTFFFLAVIVGTIVGIGLVIPRAVRARRWGKSRALRYGGRDFSCPLARRAFRNVMPFGPMLALGAVAALFYGAQINDAYWNFVNPGISSPFKPSSGGTQLMPRYP